jgi:ribose transport system substrate-binding protein
MKRIIVGFLVLIIILNLTGCGSIYSSIPQDITEDLSAESSLDTSETSDAAESAETSNKEVYYTVGMHIILPYWQDHRMGLETAAKELGVDVVFTGENGNNALRQVDIFNQVVEKNPAGILVSPIDKEMMIGPINAAMAKGIPVVCIDTDSPDSNRLTYFGTDNYKSGYLAGDIIGKGINGTGDVGVLTIPGIYSLDQRTKGFTDCIAEKYPDISVVSIMNDEADPSKAANIAGNMFKEFPTIVGVFGTDAASGVGAAIALRENNKLGVVKVVAFDKDSAVLDLVEEGLIEATLVQRTFTMSYYGLKFLYDYNHNRVKMLTNDSSISPLPSIVDTGIIVVTKDNVESFR